MNVDVARKIFYSGDERYGATFLPLACAMFDAFIENARQSGLDTLCQTIVVDQLGSYFRFFFYGNSGNIHIHAVHGVREKEVAVPLTLRNIKCHWNRKVLFRRYTDQWTGQVVEERITSPTLLLSNGFEKVVVKLSDWKIGVVESYVFGEKLFADEKGGQINSGFFEDDVLSGEYPAITGLFGEPLLVGPDFYMITSALSVHKCRLAYTPTIEVSYGFYYREYLDLALDFDVLGQAGTFVNGKTGLPVAGYTPLLGDNTSRLLRKSRVKFASHGVDGANEMTVVPVVDVSIWLSNTYYGGGHTDIHGNKYHGPCFFVGTADFPQGASGYQDFVGQSSAASIQGTTTLASMYHEVHYDDLPYYGPELLDCDWYWFGTVNSATIHLKSVAADGNVTSASFQVLNNKTISGNENQRDPERETEIVTIPNQAGCIIRDVGWCMANTLKAAKVLGAPRNVFFVTDYSGVLHDQLDYNVFVNPGGGFVALNSTPVDVNALVYARDWSEDCLFFSHNYRAGTTGYPDLSICAIDVSAPSIIVDMLVTYFPVHTDGKKKETRVFRSKNYKWVVVYNATDAVGNDISGVYERSGATLTRVGDATGIEPVEIAADESYLLMQDKAYGAMSGAFNRLVGFFYDKHHYLEMQSRVEDNLKRFVIKNLDNEEINALDWGMYSFYETSEDCSFAVITHCSINGVVQSTSNGTARVVNFIDGPYEFETICGGAAYSFSIDVPDGYVDTPVGSDPHPPELASPYYGPPDREPPYGRKQISICYCTEQVVVEGQPKTRHRHHVMVSPCFGQGFFHGGAYCMHRPGFVHQRVATVPIRTIYRNCRQQAYASPPSENNLITLLGMPDGYFYERITDELGPVDPLLLNTGEQDNGSVVLKQS